MATPKQFRGMVIVRRCLSLAPIVAKKNEGTTKHLKSFNHSNFQPQRSGFQSGQCTAECPNQPYVEHLFGRSIWKSMERLLELPWNIWNAAPNVTVWQIVTFKLS